MKASPSPSSSRIADIIAGRTTSDRKNLIEGWQNLLQDLLTQMKPYLRAGQLVTFRTLTDEERTFFEALHSSVKVPTSVSAVYLSPSVRHRMTARRPSGGQQPSGDRSPENPPDKGILLAGRTADLGIIVNALFAKPPYTPAIDVYDTGRLLAGYVYNTIDECLADLTHVLHTHLKRPSG